MGKLDVSFCASNIVRVRYSPSGEFAEKTLHTFTVSQSWAPVAHTKTEEAGVVRLTTDQLEVRIDSASDAVSFYTPAGEQITAEAGRTVEEKEIAGQTCYRIGQTFASPKTEYLYGFGNINDAVGLRNIPVSIEQNNVRKRTPMFLSNRGYGILFDVTSNGALSWAETDDAYTYTCNAAPYTDYYFFYGPALDDVIAGYYIVTGRAAMLPKNALGYVQSRNRYGSQAELLSIVEKFREKNIPLDHIVLDYFWWKGDFNNILEWNENFPDPKAMMDALHEQHVTASISIWPSFKPGTPTYDKLLAAGCLLDTPSGFGQNYDPSNPTAAAMYWECIDRNVFSKGMDSIWLDACEPETSLWVSNDAGEPAFGGDTRLMGTLYPLLTNRAVYEGQRAVPGNQKRVNTLSRGAVAGTQRYGIQSWSGDIPAGWDQLHKEILGALNYSASGLPYFSTDTGGYFGINVNDPDSRETFFRWLQLSTFMTIMRVHGTQCAKEPWQFGAQYEAYITDYIHLRERMMPYIYSLAGKVTQEGYTMMRPLVFDFREDPAACRAEDQFLFGPALMVAPVYHPGETARDVYIPAGRWINFWTGETIDSKGETHLMPAPLKKLPVLVRAGSVLPLGPFQQYATESADPIELRVYMGADGAFTLYEDEGNNYNYENGAFAEIPFTWDEASKTLTVGERTGSFEGMLENRTFHVVFVQPNYGIGIGTSKSYQATIAYDGSAQSVTFDPLWETPAPPVAALPRI